MKLMYRCPKCETLGYSQDLGYCASCNTDFLNKHLGIVAARNSDISYTNMPFSFHASEKNLLLQEKIPFSAPQSFIYGLCFAEFLRIKRAKVVQENSPWDEYLDYLLETLESEFSENSAQIDYLLCRWLFASLSDANAEITNGIERRLIFQEALAIFYMFRARKSGYRFSEKITDPIGHDETQLIADKLDTEEVENELRLCVDSPLNCALYNPIMKATLACMPYRDESVENELSSFVGLNKLVNN